MTFNFILYLIIKSKNCNISHIYYSKLFFVQSLELMDCYKNTLIENKIIKI